MREVSKQLNAIHILPHNDILRRSSIFKMGKQAQGAYMTCPIHRPSPFKPSTVVLDSHYLHTTRLLETGQVQQEEFTAVLAAMWLHNQNQVNVSWAYPRAGVEAARWTRKQTSGIFG